ncbi:MAG: ATP phosphoribosyltransferase regulatory subunit [Limnospira sp. PMC 1291.21]|uniref:ATP phosphoribosyltransferase regulatory subunit n=1 Tax=unclassified Limnospira TaxID=2642885 RepID=UPI0028E0C0F9|nr:MULTISPECIES: ATP phosphoribosyltransferase regulatory subunit [unclassified Limnospira]MDT9179401.1 ATP phosphoribosyltransferase regulatory subunit [Limnospira sp. PMC 1238.20]MDT9194309.1 ATP phosphoribosyltransferase regulatory subunit [Limnospira sp. PMC 1245.20]MDT9204997.1 ATP phosphoribosyltransferase regulatory subunit [Limnospira sp. PMC 1243.20]MDT9210975.1 ATP phosphoribosyltransferase regulatory subunit [Limnospira sp. PMC 1252.20]MDT9216076.1 ATP phosphoribosyltransferase regu
MIHQPPPGARDLLPLDVAQKIWIERRLQQVFHGWGYHRIITSTLERLDTLMAGGAVQRSTVIQLQDAENEGLGLRPELTASIARAAVSRMAGNDHWPQRLYYNANIFRKGGETGHGTQLEFYQAGVELLGADGVRADSEVLLLLWDCLRSLNLQNPQFILGEAGLTRSLLSPFPPPLRDQVRQAIANLDRITLETLSMSPELRQRALFLFDLRGRPEDVLAKVSQLDLDHSQRSALNNLKSLIDGLNQYQKLRPDTLSPMSITLDLSLIQTFDYYTGIVFIVVSDSHSGSRVLGRGGRYDQLLGLYHPQGETKPSIGFSLTIEELHQVLLDMGELPSDIPSGDCLVVPKTPQAEAAAFAYAQDLRQSPDAQVQMELSISDDLLALRESARRRGITQIAWVDEQGNPTLEVL